MVSDELIPGTLNIGHTPPTLVQAIIYITAIAVDRQTLALLIGASVVGAWFGAGIVSGWDKRRIQRGMAMALLVTAVFIVLRMTGIFPGGGDALGLHGVPLVAAQEENRQVKGRHRPPGKPRKEVQGRSLRCGIGNWCTLEVSGSAGPRISH